MRVTPFTQPVCAVGANSGGLAAPQKRSQHDHKCERGMGGSKRILRVTPFTQPVCAVGANSGGLAAPQKRSQHDHKCERGMGGAKGF